MSRGQGRAGKGRTDHLRRFLFAKRSINCDALTAVSLFSGAGLSDIGYEQAGFKFAVQVEKEADRAELGAANFPHSDWVVRSVRSALDDAKKHLRARGVQSLDLLVATPPCQGMSSSNPGRGRRSTKKADAHHRTNQLIMETAKWARELRPRVIVAENVRQILTLPIGEKHTPLAEVLKRRLPEYTVFAHVANVANYGVPQDRRRAVIVAVRKDEEWLRALSDGALPWPRQTHHADGGRTLERWLTLREWLQDMKYEVLTAKSAELARGEHPLHFVPHYDAERFLLVSSIPRNSGRSAYENDACPSCRMKGVPVGIAKCSYCGCVMRNRPIVRNGKSVRLIDGFHSSYRRMAPGLPASTVTTNSSHVGSDNKIHPWEHRVLSILECSDLQTVPRFYDWSAALTKGRYYLIRNVIGEAFPPYFTYLHGKILHALLAGKPNAARDLAAA